MVKMYCWLMSEMFHPGIENPGKKQTPLPTGNFSSRREIIASIDKTAND